MKWYYFWQWPRLWRRKHVWPNRRHLTPELTNLIIDRLAQEMSAKAIADIKAKCDTLIKENK